jgi:hypothetical protein
MMTFLEFLNEKIEPEKWKNMTKEERFKASSRIPDFIKTQFKSPVNIKELTSLGITKKSNLEKISKVEARKSNFLVLYRNALPINDDSVWLGYTIGDKVWVYRPSELGLPKIEKENIITPKIIKKRKKALIDKSDFAYKVNIERITELKLKYKKEHPKKEQPENTKVFDYYSKKVKDIIIILLNKIEQILKNDVNKINSNSPTYNLIELFYYNKEYEKFKEIIVLYNKALKSLKKEEMKNIYDKYNYIK